nr:very short patch repair endonuclease [uncultured Hyphomicrobium sp.]
MSTIGPSKTKLSLSEHMARIRKVDTKPEMIVRQLVHAMGYRFRLHRRDLPGAPDLVFPSRRKVIFVHGCFWHRHDCPDGRKIPRSKPEYWIPKLERNKQRDKTSVAQLEKLGWQTLTLWECQLKDLDQLRGAITQFLQY